MSNTQKLIDEIKSNLKQCSASTRDEVSVAMAMLNDEEFTVGVYEKGAGKVADYCPHSDFVKMNAIMIGATTKVKAEEAESMAAGYKANRAAAQSFVNLSKTFTDSYLTTGRKFNLGGREDHSFALSIKNVEAGTKKYPASVGKNEAGSTAYTTVEKNVPAHKSLRAYGSCPEWLNKAAY